MAGIYIHIPFCKRRCNYCDFYKSCDLQQIAPYLSALEAEMQLQTGFLHQQTIQTVYLGGGTPSVLSISELRQIFNALFRCFDIAPAAEITIEANPNDLTPAYLAGLQQLPVNRLSIGIQSFSDTDLQFLNRRHSAQQAIAAVKEAQRIGFSNLTIDLIYGLPHSTPEHWENQLKTAFSLNVQHLSAYHLTIEEGTPLHRQWQQGCFDTIGENESWQQFLLLKEVAVRHGFRHYEISNFAREGYFSRHNSAYWEQKPYLGLGASAHSFRQHQRCWNIADVNAYIAKINRAELPTESETLTPTDHFNEYILTALRTDKGIDTQTLQQHFAPKHTEHFFRQIATWCQSQHVVQQSRFFRLSDKGQFLADRITADLFFSD